MGLGWLRSLGHAPSVFEGKGTRGIAKGVLPPLERLLSKGGTITFQAVESLLSFCGIRELLGAMWCPVQAASEAESVGIRGVFTIFGGSAVR